MNKLFQLIALLAFVFVLTYDPKSRKLEKVIDDCCGNADYMARNPQQCENSHYQGVQFGETDYGCPPKFPPTHLGALV
jgi:hypothetical protein